jgi:hypothetical protein
MFSTLGLLLSVQAATHRELMAKCDAGYDKWQNVNSNQWYYETDWEEQIQAGNTIYPAGFKSYVLGQYNDPPICMLVPGSKDKKVEILIESPMENVNLCITDASYNGISNNNVGSVDNCGTGKIYACFTAALAENLQDDGTGTDVQEDFGFYVSCQEGCEDMAIDVWVRVRLSTQSWTDGKNGTDSDLEHWCEGERGNTFTDGDGVEQNLYTYPSDLIPDEPSNYPFHIRQIFGRNSAGSTKPHIWLVSVVALACIACLFA